MELCGLIDRYYVPRFSRGSEEATIYTLTSRERTSLFETLRQDLNHSRYASRNDERTPIGKAGLSGKFVTEAQLARCLAMNYSAT